MDHLRVSKYFIIMIYFVFFFRKFFPDLFNEIMFHNDLKNRDKNCIPNFTRRVFHNKNTEILQNVNNLYNLFVGL